ncbi:hypothetical protein Tco_1151688 [Tanacetum coccineum]
MQEVILFYNGLGIPTRQILDSRGAIPSKTTAEKNSNPRNALEILSKNGLWENKLRANIRGNNANPCIRTKANIMEDNPEPMFWSESAKRHEENSNLIMEIRASTEAAIRNQGASIKTLEIRLGK